MRKYGWIPDLPDHRDFMYAAPRGILQVLPPQIDLTPVCPPVYDQLALGSCTANAIGGAHQFEQMKQIAPEAAFTPSRLFIYWNERRDKTSDSGAMIRDGIKSVVKQGVCPEDEWPYDIAQFANKPPQPCYDDAMKHQVVSYHRLLPLLNQMKGCLADGYPFVFGFSVYESFESTAVTQTGIVPMPGSDESMIGGHAVMAVGYDDATQRFIVRNSWGAAWGKKGYCFMPYTYLTDPNLAADMWTIRMVEVCVDKLQAAGFTFLGSGKYL